jgi:hypothetical protein
MQPFSSLLFTNKIFLTSAAGVCLCFHTQSGPKNPKHLKFMCVSSVYHWQHTVFQVFILR